VATAVDTPQHVDTSQHDGHSTVELVRIASDQVSRLVRSEIQLAKAELAEKGKRAGMGVGMLATAGVLVFFGAGAIIATFALLLDLVLPAWAAALIVAGGLFVLAAGLVLAARASLKRALPPVPTATVASVRADLDAAKHAVADRRPS
jgi:uncharacterized membrane protein YqjE